MVLLYGVVGEGMGHATRSRVVIDHLQAMGHHVRVVASQRAYTFLAARFADHPRVEVHEIHQRVRSRNYRSPAGRGAGRPSRRAARVWARRPPRRRP